MRKINRFFVIFYFIILRSVFQFDLSIFMFALPFFDCLPGLINSLTVLIFLCIGQFTLNSAGRKNM